VIVPQFRRFLATRPFQPFAIHMADRRQFTIRHPEAAMLLGAGRTFVVLNDQRLHEVVDLLMVTSLRPLPQDELE
jgi:hypothetical protein